MVKIISNLGSINDEEHLPKSHMPTSFTVAKRKKKSL